MTEGISRREFLGLAALATVGAGLRRFPEKVEGETPTSVETQEKENEPTRKEKFAPLGGNMEWQYLEFQYKDENNQRIGVTLSMSRLPDEEGNDKYQLLSSSHNLATGETNSHIHDGNLHFDGLNSKYTFTDDNGDTLAVYQYDENEDHYTLTTHTDQFDTNDIDPKGIVLKPQGQLIPVSGDAHFTVAAWLGGGIETEYWGDNVIIQKQDGSTVSHGRRDSQSLKLVGIPNFDLDMDHTWVHTCATLNDGTLAYITAWEGKTGGDFRFADVMILNPNGGLVSFDQFNEKTPGFSLTFTSPTEETETVDGNILAHGGKIVADYNGQPLFNLSIDGNAGQILKDKIGGLIGFSMVEAHGELKSGTVNGIAVKESYSAIWETTDEEKKKIYLPMVSN
jgi:hypothetical protein